MRCHRCQGCMVASEEAIARFCTRAIPMRKCLNCGNREDDYILQQRRFMHPVMEDRYTMIWNRIKHLNARLA